MSFLANSIIRNFLILLMRKMRTKEIWFFGCDGEGDGREVQKGEDI